jgi:heme-degrading monooxygenase HmoA
MTSAPSTTPGVVAPVYTTGSWRPFPGHEDAFLDAWRRFATWSCRMPGAQLALLARDLRDPDRFVSFMSWDSADDVRGWKGSAEFKARMAPVQEHTDKFAPTELEVVATAAAGDDAIDRPGVGEPGAGLEPATVRLQIGGSTS